MAEAEGQIVFQGRIVPGPAERSFGIHVAQMAGIPEAVVRRARQVLAVLEKRGAREQQRAAIAQVDGEPPRGAEDNDPVGTALDRLDVERLTPREALLALQELQALHRSRRAAR